LSVADLDDTSPAFESAITGTGWVGTPFLYEAIAVDVDTPDEALVYSLADSGDASLLAIESDSGVVTLKSGVVAEGDTYTFTVVVTDGTNAPTSQTVTVNATNPAISAVGTPAPILGGIGLVATDNPDGTATVDFFLREPFATDLGAAIGDFQFNLNFDPALLGVVGFDTPFALTEVNDETPGALAVAGISLAELDLSDGSPLISFNVTPYRVVGGIDTRIVSNEDGTQTIELFLADSVASSVGAAVGDYQFVFNFDPAQMTIVNYLSEFPLVEINDETSGQLVIAGISLTDLDLSAGQSLGQLIVSPAMPNSELSFSIEEVIVANTDLSSTFVSAQDANVEISVTGAIVGVTDLPDTFVTFPESQEYVGTDGSDVFLLGGGSMDITGGGGIDAFVITADFGDSTAVNLLDFTPGEDVIDMSALMQSIGYVALDDPDTSDVLDGELRKYSETSIDLLSLLEGNDASFDNSFGFLNDVDNGVIIGFYDANSSAEEVDIKTFEINIAEATADITIDDFTASIGGFIA
jgi:hypothetical protein